MVDTPAPVGLMLTNWSVSWSFSGAGPASALALTGRVEMLVRAACLMTTAICAGGFFASAAAYAAEVKPAVIYDLGGKFDKSFNEGVFNGATRFKKDTGIDFHDLEIQNEAQREQALRRFAKDGYSPI